MVKVPWPVSVFGKERGAHVSTPTNTNSTNTNNSNTGVHEHARWSLAALTASLDSLFCLCGDGGDGPLWKRSGRHGPDGHLVQLAILLLLHLAFGVMPHLEAVRGEGDGVGGGGRRSSSMRRVSTTKHDS